MSGNAPFLTDLDVISAKNGAFADREETTVKERVDLLEESSALAAFWYTICRVNRHPQGGDFHGEVIDRGEGTFTGMG